MKGTSFMIKEITSQPKLWKDTYEYIKTKKNQINGFLSEIYKLDNLQIILTGAGSSAFIGEIIQHSFNKNTKIPVKAIPTTDLVTHPVTFFRNQFQR